MKFTIGKRPFAQAIRIAHAFGKPARTGWKTDGGHEAGPVRYPVTLAASPLGLEITAFDGKATLTQRVRAGVSASGSVTLDADTLRSALAGPKARDIVTFEAQGDAAHAAMAECRLLDSGKATSLGRARTGNGYHSRLELGERPEARLEVPAAELAAILAETAFAASTDPSRPYLTTLFIQSEGGQLRAVATDGWRMAIRDTNLPLAASALPEDGNNGHGAILPLKPLRALQRLLTGCGSVTVEIWTGGVRFRCRAGEVATEFRGGSFLDYRRIIPGDRMKSAPLDLAALSEAMKAATPGARSAGHWLKVTVNGRVTLSEGNGFSSDGEETLLPVECRIEGDPIGFKAHHLDDIARAFGQVATVMRYTQPGDPAMFVSPDRPELAVVQMPSRI